jgi:membrane protein implicated in regulation of membrane protease activity
MSPGLIWLLAGVVLVGAETISGELFLLMLGGGALAAAAGAAFGLGWLGSAVVFAIVSVALLLVARPVLRRRMEANLPSLDTHHRTMTGRSAEVVERVDGESGRVRIAGELWSARSLDGHEVIEAGTTATVMEVSGAVALVTGRDELPGE